MIIHPPLKGKNQIFSKISNKNLKKIKSNFFLRCKVKIKSNLDLIKLLTKFLILSF